MQRVLATIVWTCLLASTQALAFDKPPFPHLAINWIADQRYEDPAVQTQLAQGNIALISVWKGWETGRGTTVEQVIRNIKSKNPNTLIFNYINNNEISTDRVTYSNKLDLYTKLDTMAWYLYPTGKCCTAVTSAWPGAVEINNTLFAPTDSNGDRWLDFYAKWTVKTFATPSPSLDGFNTDNVFWKPRVDGDWNRDGTVDSKSNATSATWYRQGYARHFTLLKQLMPGKFQIGNVADWGDPSAVITEYQGLLDGGVMEGLIGYDWSVEHWANWKFMMDWYRKTMAAFGSAKLGIFHQVGSVTDYQGFRYGFGSCLLDDGYFAFNSSAAGNDAPWFDEYAVKLGYATTSPQTAAWQNGVYRRDFENGIVLVNPRGNGPKTITLEGDFQKIVGKQDTAVNDGKIVRTVTLKDRDAIVLRRLTPKARPKAPVLSAM